MLKNMRVWQRLALVSAAFIVPIVVLVHLLSSEIHREITFAERQRQGVEYILPVRRLLQDVQQHRGMSVALLDGDQTFKDKLSAKELDVENDLKAVEDAGAKAGSALDVGTAFGTIKQRWGTVKASGTGTTAAQSFARHSELVLHIIQLMERAANASGLVRDPDVDSYHTMDVLVNRIPQLTEELGQARALGAGAIARAGTGEVAAADKVEIAALTARARESVVGTTDSLKYAFEANTKLAATLKPVVEYSTQNVNEYLDMVDRKVLKAAAPGISAADYFALATRSIDGTLKLFDAVAAVHEDLLATRIERLGRNRSITLGAVAAGIVLSLLLVLLAVRSITGPLALLRDTAEKISLGEMDARFDIQSKDELGELAEQFRRMQMSLKAAMNRLEQDG